MAFRLRQLFDLFKPRRRERPGQDPLPAQASRQAATPADSPPGPFLFSEPAVASEPAVDSEPSVPREPELSH
jgi:hypothetical protein